MTKSIDTLVKDIYAYLESYSAVTPEQSTELALILSRVITEKLSTYRKPALSMSCIGHPKRKLKLELENPIKPSGKARLKFLYGDLLEVLLLWLAKQAGHDVESQQDSVEVDGVHGHIDAIIDGVLVDLKSASPQSYKKFAGGTLPTQDPFGYLAQISGYREALDKDQVAFLAVDKVSGDLCLYKPNVEFDLPDPHAVIKEAKEAISSPLSSLPHCEEPVPMGKSGNMKLSTGCKYCAYRDKCWDNLRVFLYKSGPEYLTKVVKEPADKIKEITTKKQ